MSPKDTAIYWTEYVINHRGAKHLQYVGIHQNFWQRNSVDVIALLLFCLWIIVKSLSLIVKKLNNLTNLRCFGKGNKVD